MRATRAFRMAATGARLITGAAVAVACVFGVVAAVHAPWPTVRSAPVQAEITPLPGNSELVCNGDLRALGRDSSAPFVMDSAATPDLVQGQSSGDPSLDPITATDLVGAGDVPTLTAVVEGRTAPLLAAAESASIAATDLAGFAALPCGTPLLDSWLVGGSVSTGTEDIIILTNTADVPSTVTLSVYGTLRGARTVIVPAHAQAGVPLAAIAAGNEAPVVNVIAVGAPVRAVLQSSVTRVLDPAGIDLQEAVPGAQQNVVLTGVRSFPVAGDEADMTVVRLLSPDSDAEARISVTPEDSGVAVDELTIPLVAGVPASVALTGLDPGTYTVEIDSDAPVLGAARIQDGAGLGDDFAWVTPAPEIDGEVLFAVPRSAAPRLQLANTTDADATVTIEPLDGASPRDVVIPAGQTRGLDVSAGASYRLRTTGTVHGAVAVTAPGALAVLSIRSGAGAERAITVYP